MRTKMLCTLDQAIQKWIDDSCEVDCWPDVIVPPDLAERMASAAAGILDAIEDSQKYARREGYFTAQPATPEPATSKGGA